MGVGLSAYGVEENEVSGTKLGARDGFSCLGQSRGGARKVYVLGCPGVGEIDQATAVQTLIGVVATPLVHGAQGRKSDHYDLNPLGISGFDGLPREVLGGINWEALRVVRCATCDQGDRGESPGEK